MSDPGTLVTRRTLLPFETMGEFFHTVAQVPFAVQGLGVWGAQPGDTIEQMQVSSSMVAAGGGWIPAQFYAMAPEWGYAAFAAALEAGGVLPLSWGPEYFLSPGTMFRLRGKRVDGQPATHLTVACWGYQLVAHSFENLSSFPDVSYFDLLDKERAFLVGRVAAIDATLSRVERPKPDKPKSPIPSETLGTADNPSPLYLAQQRKKTQ